MYPVGIVRSTRPQQQHPNPRILTQLVGQDAACGAIPNDNIVILLIMGLWLRLGLWSGCLGLVFDDKFADHCTGFNDPMRLFHDIR